MIEMITVSWLFIVAAVCVAKEQYALCLGCLLIAISVDFG